MEQHVKILGITYIVYGIIGLLPIGFILLLLVGPGMLSGDMTAIAIMSTIALFACAMLFLFSIPEIIAGIWLMQYKQWARWLTIVLGILNLLAFPVGTALGIYTLWVLLHGDTIVLFETGAEIATSPQVN
jgi:hypothetical protein